MTTKTKTAAAARIEQERAIVEQAKIRVEQAPPMREHGLTESERMYAYGIPTCEAASIVTLGALVASAVAVLWMVSPFGGAS